MLVNDHHGLKLCDEDLGEGKEVSLRGQLDQLIAAVDLAQTVMQPQPETNQDNRTTKPSN